MQNYKRAWGSCKYCKDVCDMSQLCLSQRLEIKGLAYVVGMMYHASVVMPKYGKYQSVVDATLQYFRYIPIESRICDGHS